MRELPLGDHAWVTLVVREGGAMQPSGSLVLRAGDRVFVLTEPPYEAKLAHLFQG